MTINQNTSPSPFGARLRRTGKVSGLLQNANRHYSKGAKSDIVVYDCSSNSFIDLKAQRVYAKGSSEDMGGLLDDDYLSLQNPLPLSSSHNRKIKP